MRFVTWLIFIILINGVIWAVCNLTAEPRYVVHTCESLSEEIIDLSKEEEDAYILKLYSITEPSTTGTIRAKADPPNSKIILGCTADASWSDGGFGRIWFWVNEDSDGDRFIAYEATIN